jgi:hypothetical protein
MTFIVKFLWPRNAEAVLRLAESHRPRSHCWVRCEKSPGKFPGLIVFKDGWLDQ